MMLPANVPSRPKFQMGPGLFLGQRAWARMNGRGSGSGRGSSAWGPLRGGIHCYEFPGGPMHPATSFSVTPRAQEGEDRAAKALGGCSEPESQRQGTVPSAGRALLSRVTARECGAFCRSLRKAEEEVAGLSGRHPLRRARAGWLDSRPHVGSQLTSLVFSVWNRLTHKPQRRSDIDPL